MKNAIVAGGATFSGVLIAMYLMGIPEGMSRAGVLPERRHQIMILVPSFMGLFGAMFFEVFFGDN